MALNLATATNVLVHRLDNEDVLVRWDGTLPASSVWQLYANRRLVWYGRVNRTVIPLPVSTRSVRIEIGSAGDAEAQTNLSSSLAAIPGGGNQVTLKWYGGKDISDDFVAFHVYVSGTSGGSVDYGNILATVRAITDPAIAGAGMGGAGEGGAGVAETIYQWTSKPMPSGTWNYGVKAVDSSGNESAAITFSAVIETPPQQVPMNANRTRMTGSYSPSTRVLTLSWLAAQA